MSVAQPALASIGVHLFDGSAADALLRDWEHPLGACERPFGRQDFVLEVDGDPIALATSASTVSKTVAGYKRQEVVELARIARHPDHRGILRVMLRLWREYLARRWPYWSVVAAISYQMPGTKGDLYRFDGWERHGVCRPSPGGGTWTIKDPKVSKIADGRKTLWVYRYEGAA